MRFRVELVREVGHVTLREAASPSSGESSTGLFTHVLFRVPSLFGS